MHNKLLKQAISTIMGTAIILGSSQVQSANWFKLRGTEPGGTAHTLQVWGFLQPRYESDYSSKISGVTPPPLAGLNGTIPTAGTTARERNAQDGFRLRRARIGIRGTMLPINNDINYFILTEWGQNGVTDAGQNSSGSSGAQLLDASVTFNQLSRGQDEAGLQNFGARIRAGQFLFSQTSESLSHSTPGRRVHMWMPEATLANAMRRPTYDNGANNFPGSTPVNAARDIGIEVFDFTEFGDPKQPFEFTYSLALGNGDTIGEQNRDNNFRKYAWLSIGQLLDETRGPRRHDWMLYGWWQQGDISFNDDINDDGKSDQTQINPVNGFVGGSTCVGTAGNQSLGGGGRLCRNGNQKDYEQTYLGYGFEYFDKPFESMGQIRFNAEWQKQYGFTFDGANSPSIDFITGIRYQPTGGHNEGWYADIGYDIQQHLGIKNRTTLNVRYDELDRNQDNDSRAVHMKSTTFTGEYFFHPKARLTLSYAIRDFDANQRKGVPETVGNQVLSPVGNRIGLELTFIFRNVLIR
ncbi:MAG: hypothetical protein RQ982_12375 [Gammaproteobacteria bacterium]|nr:hypothetical protein [Gammaproteobacteria bacterium]